MIKINMQYFGDNGASSGKSGAGGGAAGGTKGSEFKSMNTDEKVAALKHMSTSEADKVLSQEFSDASERKIKTTYPQERTTYRIVDDKVSIRWDTPIVKETERYAVYSTKKGYYIQELVPQTGGYASLRTDRIKKLNW